VGVPKDLLDATRGITNEKTSCGIEKQHTGEPEASFSWPAALAAAVAEMFPALSGNKGLSRNWIIFIPVVSRFGQCKRGHLPGW
jgi:hypothetical protein